VSYLSTLAQLRLRQLLCISKVSKITLAVTTWVNSSSKCTKIRYWPGLCPGPSLFEVGELITRPRYSNRLQRHTLRYSRHCDPFKPCTVPPNVTPASSHPVPPIFFKSLRLWFRGVCCQSVSDSSMFRTTRRVTTTRPTSRGN